MFLKLCVFCLSTNLFIRTIPAQSPPKVPQLFPQNQPNYPQPLSVYTKPKSMEVLPLSIKALQTAIPKSPYDRSCSQTLENILEFLFEREFDQNPQKSASKYKPRLESDATKLLMNARSEATQKLLQNRQRILEATGNAVQQILRNHYPSLNIASVKITPNNAGLYNFGAVQNGQRFVQYAPNINPIVNYLGRSCAKPSLANYLANGQIVRSQNLCQKLGQQANIRSLDSSLNDNESLIVVYKTKTVPIVNSNGNVPSQMYKKVLVPYQISKVL